MSPDILRSRVCNSFAQLGARGSSIVFSSGDQCVLASLCPSFPTVGSPRTSSFSPHYNLYPTLFMFHLYSLVGPPISMSSPSQGCRWGRLLDEQRTLYNSSRFSLLGMLHPPPFTLVLSLSTHIPQHFCMTIACPQPPLHHYNWQYKWHQPRNSCLILWGWVLKLFFSAIVPDCNVFECTRHHKFQVVQVGREFICMPEAILQSHASFFYTIWHPQESLLLLLFSNVSLLPSAFLPLSEG